MHRFQFVSSRASHLNFILLTALMLSIFLASNSRVAAEGLVPADIQVEYYNYSFCEANRSSCCYLLKDWSNPWGIISGGIAEPEEACLGILEATREYMQCEEYSESTLPTGVWQDASLFPVCELTSYGGTSRQTTLSKFTTSCPPNSIPGGNGYCVCDPGVYPSNGNCEPCGCGHHVVNGQCVEMTPVNEKVWQPNGDMWVYRYGAGQNCNIKKHPQYPHCEDSQGNGPGDKQGNPISCTTGIKTQTETDYRSAGPDPLTVQRFYSSSVEDVAAGQPTQLNVMNDRYKVRLQYLSGVKLVKIFWPDGGLYVFDVPGDAPGTVGHSDQADKGYVERTATGWDYVTAGSTRYHFGDGGLLGLVRPGGHAQTVTYRISDSGQNQIATITNAFGISLQYNYDDQDRLSSIQLPDGNTIQYGYDDRDHLNRVTYPDDTPLDDSDNPTRLYHFENPDFPDALTGITDENGNRFATWAYDEAGRAILSEHADGAEKVTLDYIDDSHTRVRIWQNDTDYRDEIYTFEKRGGHYRITEIETLPCTGCTVGSEQWQYNDDGYLIQHTDANGNVTMYERDERGREISRTEAFGTPEARTATTQWHDEFSLPVKIIEPGKTLSYTYDADGNRLSETVTDTTGLCADGQGNGCSRTTTYSHNSQGLLLTVDGPRTDVNDVTTFGYDAQGNRNTVTNALNQVTQIVDYDANGNPLTTIDPSGIRTELRYDARQRLISRTVAAGTADTAVTRFEYDAAGNLTKIMQPNGAYLQYIYDAAHRPTAIEDNLGNRINYTLDTLGNRTAATIKDANGVLVKTKSTIYNALGHMLEQLGANDQRIAYQYDNNGNTISTTDPKNQSTLQAFDALNRLIRIEDPANGGAVATRYEYDAQGNLAKVTDPKGLATSYQYNGFGELLQQTSPDTGLTTYRYDLAGDRIAQTDARGIEVHYAYDALNRLTRIDYPGTEDDVEYVYDQGQNGIGRLSAIDDASGHTEYQYDARGNVTQVSSQFPLPQGEGINNITLVTGYVYDNANNLIQIIYPSGKTVNITRNALSQTERITLNGSILADNIKYKPFGLLYQLTYGNGLTETRSYDLDYRITRINVPGIHDLNYDYDANSNIADITDMLNSAQNQNFGYDPLDRLLNAQGGYGTLGYTYDPVGNRLQKTSTTEGTSHTEIYQYGAQNHHLLQRDDMQYQYDAAGNTVHNSEFAFTYNQANRLSIVHNTEGKQVAEYRYNALGQRTIKIVGTDPPDYAAMAEEQEALAEQYRSDANAKQNQADALETQAAESEQRASADQLQAETLRREAVEDRAAAEALEPQIAELKAEAQPWVERADRFRVRIVEPPQHIRDRVRNAAFSLVAGVFQAIADVYLNQAADLTSEAQALRDGAAVKEQQAAALDTEATQLLASAEQARQDAQTLRMNVVELITLAEEAEASAAEYRALAENPPETKKTLLFVYDQTGLLIGEYDETGSVVREYLYLNGQPFAMLQDEDIYYAHNSHLGTPEKFTNQNQQVAWQASHNPFGRTNITMEQITNNLRLPGQYFDVETGIHYNWNRYYSPQSSRYITSDPIGLEAGLNTYLYATANPLSFSDPDGLDIMPKSPNPNNVKKVIPSTSDIVCALVEGVDSARQKAHESAYEIHVRNMKKIQESCDIRYQNCRYLECMKDFQECVKRATQECKKMQEHEFDRHIRAMENINSSYPVNASIKEFCGLL